MPLLPLVFMRSCTKLQHEECPPNEVLILLSVTVDRDTRWRRKTRIIPFRESEGLPKEGLGTADTRVLSEELTPSGKRSYATKRVPHMSAALGLESVPSCHPSLTQTYSDPEKGQGKSFLVSPSSSSLLHPYIPALEQTASQSWPGFLPSLPSLGYPEDVRALWCSLLLLSTLTPAPSSWYVHDYWFPGRVSLTPVPSSIVVSLAWTYNGHMEKEHKGRRGRQRQEREWKGLAATVYSCWARHRTFVESHLL